MAIKQAIASYRIQDAVGVTKSFEAYVTFDDATATLSSISAILSVLCASLDGITDGVITAQSLKLFFPLPESGIKTTPTAGSDVEETGLLTFNTNAPAGKVYSQDVPAVAQAVLVGRSVDAANVNVTDWTDHMAATGETFRHVDNRWSYGLGTLKGGQKTFRKHRQALKRA